jgi:hypothetical protein
MYTNGDYVDVISSMVIKLIKKGSSGIFNVGTQPKTIYELALKSSNILPIFKPDYVPGNTIMNLDKLNNEIEVSQAGVRFLRSDNTPIVQGII